MPDSRISELPAASALADADLVPLSQAQSGTSTTRRPTLAQLRGAIQAARGAQVRDYGSKGDGATKDAPAIQPAINDLASRGGGTLHLCPHPYRLASAITVSGTMVRLQGAGFTETGSAGQGTWLV